MEEFKSEENVKSSDIPQTLGRHYSYQMQSVPSENDLDYNSFDWLDKLVQNDDVALLNKSKKKGANILLKEMYNVCA